MSPRWTTTRATGWSGACTAALHACSSSPSHNHGSDFTTTLFQVRRGGNDEIFVSEFKTRGVCLTLNLSIERTANCDERAARKARESTWTAGVRVSLRIPGIR